MTGRKRVWAGLGVVWAAGISLVVAAGCDVRPGPLHTADGHVVQRLPVETADADEAAAAAELETAQANYRQALKVLAAYYHKVGNLVNQNYAEQELANLEEAQWFKITGLPAPAAQPQSIEGPNEAALVEQVVAARRNWLDKVDALAEFYEHKGLSFKARVLKRVQERFDPIRTYDYFANAEIPPSTLRPTEVIPAADTLFDKALRLHKQGKPLPLLTDYRKERQALLLFRQLVDQYPASTKIAQAAYHIGEIYKEYFDEDVRAVMWYQRAWEWDGHIQLPARSQAAFVYDIRLARYDKALALYREAIKYEQFDPSRIRYAHQRIGELTEQK